MFRPESPRSRFGKPNFILGWIASVESEISIIDLLGVDCRKRREKESKQKRTNPVHKDYAAASIIMPNRDISWMQSRTGLFRIGYRPSPNSRVITDHLASERRRALRSPRQRSIGIERHSRIRSTSLSVISSLVRS
jgi:hypothetical protein